MNSRFVGTLVAGTLAVCLAVSLAPPTAAATASSPRVDSPDTRGLFGSADPTYDGVLRQSTAIAGLAAAGRAVPARSVRWLIRQQCPDGSFAAYRPDPTAACPQPDSTAFTGPDTNSTAAAIIALKVVVAASPTKARARAAMNRAREWLARQQTPGGGWEWIAGLGPDSVSTAMAVTALSSGHRVQRATRWLARQIDVAAGCSVRFQPTAAPDPLSTAWTFIASEGPLPYAPTKGPRNAARCPGDSRAILGAGAWLATALVKGQGRIPSAYDATATDWNSTALATLGMSQRHGSSAALRSGLAALRANVDAYAGTGAAANPTALGTLLMVAHATKTPPRDFGGVDLPARLMSTLQG